MNNALTLTWYGQVVSWQQGQELELAALTTNAVDDGAVTTASSILQRVFASLPHNYPVDTFILPIENVLLRSLTLPLKSTAFVDADILGQELDDLVGIEPADWWLTWNMAAIDGQVEGLLVAIPESWKQEIDAQPMCEQLAHVYIDADLRLHALLNHQQACAVLDQDAQGLFFGFFDGEVWRGMRRINVQLPDASPVDEMSGGIFDENVWEDIHLSLQAMGFDASEMPVVGAITQPVLQRCEVSGWQWQGELRQQLASRHELTLALSESSTEAMDLRHDHWTATPSWQRFAPWRRSVLLAAMCLSLWIAMTLFDITTLEKQGEQYQQQIVTAFSEALPNQPMIDAVVQLQRAAGGGNDQQSNKLLRQLQAISESFVAHKWIPGEISLRKDEMFISGVISDLTAVNILRDSLQQALQTDIQVVDTDLAGDTVRFRMKWLCKTL